MIYRKYLLLYILILYTLFREDAGETFSTYKDIDTQNVEFSQYHEISQNDDYRLPISIKPISYEIILAPKLQKNFTFEGIVKITAVVKNETDKITLHVGNIQIVNQSVLLENKTVHAEHIYDKNTEKYTLIVSETLKKGSQILITFEYNGILNDNMIGFYRSSYFDKDNQIKWLAATQFSKTHARHAFPCFDEPSFKAKFTIRISRDEKYKCLSNMPLMKSEKLKDQFQDTFQESVPMSTYLVAFVISEFNFVGQNEFKVWSRPSVINQTNYALKIGTAALDLLGKMFQQKYDLPKMDMVALPDFGVTQTGAMENWGLVTYREPKMLYDEKESSVLAQQSVASVIVHEITHMWFGNLVTPEWWGYLWLSEAFARYFEYFGTAEIEKSWNMKEQFVVEQHESALIEDGFDSSQSMTRDVSSQSQLEGISDSITYAKAASIVRMMSFMFGTNVFELAICDYLHNNKEVGLGYPDALWEAIENRIYLQQLITRPVAVKTIMDTWTTQAGYPVVSINIDDKGVFNITQQRFLLRNLNKTPTNVTWWVPLTWATQTEPNFNDTLPKNWLSAEKNTINLTINSKEWVIFNVQSSGFYRVNYNYDGWQRIFNVLNSDKFNEIHVLNRAGIVDDLLNLGRAGLQDYETVLNGLMYLKQETNYLPFKAALNGLDYLNKRFAGYEEHSLFKEYVLSLLYDKRKNLGYEDRANDDRLTILLRREINNWACNLDDDECVTIYMKKFKQWKTNTSIPIKANERSIAYCVATRYGTHEDWEFLWKQYLNSNYVTDQTVIISALGCSLNTTILEKYLKYAISNYANNRIRKQDSTNVFAAVYNSGLTGAEYILDFVEKHYKEMEKYYGGQSTIAIILDGASQHFSTPRLVEKFQNLINKTEFAPIFKSLESSLRIARYELEWYKSVSVSIIRWLRTQEGTKYRLPTNISPQKYVISVMPYLEVGNFTVDGHVKIEADVVQQTKQIVLHSAKINHHTVTVTANQTEVKVASQNIEEKYDFYMINLDQELPVGTKLIIEIEYTSNLNPSELRGFYKSSYVDDDGKTRWLAATHLEPVGARKMFPCFDEPALKALFIVQVSVPLNYNAVSNMEWESIKKVNDRLLYTFTESIKMSTYLVAVVISDFQMKYEDANKTEYAVLARPNAINQTKYAVSLISPIVDFFETKMKQQYEISKLYMVALPDFPAGAQENWGLLTYRETNLLYDENHSPITNKQYIRNVIAHEISHQWFGNLVSPLWWKYLWLNEGFATYFEYHVPARVFNDTALEAQFVVDEVHSAFRADSSYFTHALNYDVYSPREIQSIFDSISYAKGASILRMIENSYGSEMFYTALSDYLSKRKYNVATSEDLYAAFQTQITKKGLKDNITSILDTWVTQPGYPIVHVDVKENTVSLRQERFFFKQYKDNSIWHIPITWASINNRSEYSNTMPKLWLTKNEMEIRNVSLSRSIFNVQQSGYYRVNYDEKYWIKLFDYLRNNSINTIHEINRAALIDDLMNFAQADYINYKIVISGLRYLTRENHYLPWRAFYNNLPYLNNRFRGRSTEELYKKYLVSLIEPLYTQLDFEDRYYDDDLTIMLRMHTRKWACKLDIGNCRFRAARYFQQKRYSEIIPPNYRDAVYCTAMNADITKNTYDFLWKEYLNSNVTTDKLVILSSLACSQNKTILERLLQDAITENSYIRYQDSAKVFSDVYDSSLNGIEVVMSVIKSNYDDILHKNFDDYTKIGNIVNSLASRLSTHHLHEQYQNLLIWLVAKEPAFNKFVDSYLSTAQYELEWYERKAPTILEELDKLFLPNKYRLPNSLYPELYNVTLKPDMERGSFAGKVQIYMRVENDTISIVLNSQNLNISNIKVFRNYSTSNNLNAEPIQILNYVNEKPFIQQLRIYLNSEVKNKENIMAEIDFNGILNDDMQGFYRSSYLDSDGKQHWLATTQFQPTYARKAFPCFDEPAFKSKFIINIKRLNHYNTLSNMPLSKISQSRKLKDDNYTLDIFDITEVKMSTYPVAFVISEFKPVDESEKFLNVWGRPQVVKYGKFAQDIAKAFINELQNFTNIKYSLPKLDLVGIPDFSMGAMENWGLSTFREYGLFYDETETTATYEKYMITVIAHELAHMWFGNLVTCAWWNYIWLNEGFATYFEYFVANQILPDYKFMDQFVVYELQSALLQDSSSSSHPMTSPVELPKEINNIFDYVAYAKSASILRMLFNVVKLVNVCNEEEILRHYLNKQMKYGTARPTDLWESFEQFVVISPNGRNASIEEVMNTWTNQPGYPVVNATLNNFKLTLTQERFLMNKTTTKNEFYWIPIFVVTSVDTSRYIVTNSVLLGSTPEVMFIPVSSEWFVVNYKQIGFYRVNYDTYSWQRLIRQLNSQRFESIHVLNRAQIIDDLFNLARATYVDYELVLNASKYLIREKNHLPWKAFFNGLSYVYERFEDKSNDQNYPKKFVSQIMSAMYNETGFDDRKEDTLLNRLNREMILQWACKLNNVDCVGKSKDLFAAWHNNTLSRIPRNARSAVYCTAIKEGTTKDWEFLWKRYLETNFGSEKKIIINALGCSINEKILQDYLWTAIEKYNPANATIRRQDVSAVFASVYSASQLGVSVTLNFLISNISEVFAYFDSWDDVTTLFNNVASHISSWDQYDKLSKFVESYAILDASDIKVRLASALSTAEANLIWYKKNNQTITQWIIKELSDTSTDPNGSTTIGSSNIIFMLLIALISYFVSYY